MTTTIDCICGGQAKLEHITSIKSMVSKAPVYAKRFVCTSCGAGLYDLHGSSSVERAADKFNQSMAIARELADEFNVTPKQFLVTINK